MNREDLLELIPAYALDALDDDERGAVEALLRKDKEAQALLRDYEDITSVLAFTVPERPVPAHLKSDLKARLTERQATAVTHPSTQSQAQERVLPFRTRAWVTAAAILVIVIGIGYLLLRQPMTPIHPNEILYNEIIAGDDFVGYTVTPDYAENVEGQLVISEDNSQAILRIASLPDLEDEQSYQLWLVTEEGTQNAGIFRWATGRGPYFVQVDPSIENLVALGMTLEPENGSPLGDSPTGPRLFAVEIASAQ